MAVCRASPTLAIGLTIALSAVGCSAFDAPHAEFNAVAAQLLEGHYDQAEGRARTLLETLRRARGDSAPEVWKASNLLVGALVANGRGAFPATRALAEQTVRAQEQRLRSADTHLAASLIALGRALIAAGDYSEATARLERATAIREQSSQPTDIGIAEALDSLGLALTGERRFDDALRQLDRSLRLKESRLDSGDVEIARTLEAICLARQRSGDYAAARRALERALFIQEKADPQHPIYIDGLNLLHQQLWFEGKFAESRDVARRAVNLAERTLRADHPTLARSVRYLAAAEWSSGNLNEGYTLWQRALAMASRNFGENHHETAMYLHDVALADLGLGDYPSARTRFAKALELFEARFGPWHDFVATALHNLAVVDANLGDLPSARREQARATAIWEKTLGEGHPFVAFGLTELARVLRAQGATADAVAMLERALAIREKSLGGDHPDVARTLADLASAVMQRGQIASAQALASRALRIWQQQNAPDAPEFADVLTLYADLQLKRGRSGDARRAYEKALAIREKILGPSHPDVAETRAGLAWAQARSGDPSAALASATNAETTARNHLRLMLRHLHERHSLSYAASRPGGLDLLLSMAAAEPAAAVPGLDATVRGRALVLDEMATRRSAGRSQAGHMPSLQGELASAQQRLANLLVRGPGEISAAGYMVLLENARLESERVEQRLAEESAAFRADLSQADIGVDELQAALPRGSVLISFVRHYRLSLSDGLPGVASGPHGGVAAYVAFVVRPDAAPVAVSLGEAAEIEQLVAIWRDEVARPPSLSAPPPGERKRSGESGSRLRLRVWDPLTVHLKGATRIFVVPDGALSLVPVAALPSGESYLLEQAPPIHYLSAERDLVATTNRSRAGARGLLAMGGPAFDAGEALNSGAATVTRPSKGPPAMSSLRAPECGIFQSLRFQPLNGTLEEVQELSRVWSANEGSATADALVGREATESAFKRDAHRYRVLHLATHGFFLGGGCPVAGSDTRGVGGLSGPARAVENPLLLSGLALAGANRRASAGPDEDDGILTAEEVASLDLQGVEWAVLSACDTGVGEIKAGEGVFGLRRAFQVAGARTVIMSLWSVDDQATRAWMRALYEGRFQRQLSTADAVHAAALSVLRARRASGLSDSPFYWAAFVAVGDWR